MRYLPDSSSNGTSMANATTDTLNAGLREIVIYVKTNVLDKALTDNWISHITACAFFSTPNENKKK
jgi:hypothetical protein